MQFTFRCKQYLKVHCRTKVFSLKRDTSLHEAKWILQIISKTIHSPSIDFGLGLCLELADSSFVTDCVSHTLSVKASIPIWSWSLLLRYFDKVFSFLQLSQVNSDPSTISKFLGLMCPEHLEQRKHLLWYSLCDTRRRWARYTGRPHAEHLSKPVLPNLIGAYKVIECQIESLEKREVSSMQT